MQTFRLTGRGGGGGGGGGGGAVGRGAQYSLQSPSFIEIRGRMGDRTNNLQRKYWLVKT